ncbi:hypothetical protein EDB85DRAFT_1891425 [Lactarius pseudohatsudake]|nr:hypothetical protein EDB85DRAFT_1891425 [Lactarius pseudohatsudake]
MGREVEVTIRYGRATGARARTWVSQMVATNGRAEAQEVGAVQGQTVGQQQRMGRRRHGDAGSGVSDSSRKRAGRGADGEITGNESGSEVNCWDGGKAAGQQSARRHSKGGAGEDWVDRNGDEVGDRWPWLTGRELVLQQRLVFIVSNTLLGTGGTCEDYTCRLEDVYIVRAHDLEKGKKQTTDLRSPGWKLLQNIVRADTRQLSDAILAFRLEQEDEQDA